MVFSSLTSEVFSQDSDDVQRIRDNLEARTKEIERDTKNKVQDLVTKALAPGREVFVKIGLGPYAMAFYEHSTVSSLGERVNASKLGAAVMAELLVPKKLALNTERRKFELSLITKFGAAERSEIMSTFDTLWTDPAGLSQYQKETVICIDELIDQAADLFILHTYVPSSVRDHGIPKFDPDTMNPPSSSTQSLSRTVYAMHEMRIASAHECSEILQMAVLDPAHFWNYFERYHRSSWTERTEEMLLNADYRNPMRIYAKRRLKKEAGRPFVTVPEVEKPDLGEFAKEDVRRSAMLSANLAGGRLLNLKKSPTSRYAGGSVRRDVRTFTSGLSGLNDRSAIITSVANAFEAVADGVKTLSSASGSRDRDAKLVIEDLRISLQVAFPKLKELTPETVDQMIIVEPRLKRDLGRIKTVVELLN